eukprot:TRINITY_DN875_c0_g1_i2.p1 TRINITY_DN875_c0_g1~~TRINITY_DN875_c0_g1_i2.p1  ORF type:complete len:444 (+),score=27.53 TRINITY_DN875_c0_g1_i2:152-1483(+)
MISILHNAWEQVDYEQKGSVSYERIISLLKEARKYSYFRKMLREEDFDLTIWALDVDNDGYIGKDDFDGIIPIMRLHFDHIDAPTFMHLWFPRQAISRSYQGFQNFIKSVYFEGIVWIALLCVAVYTFISFWFVLQGLPDLECSDLIEVSIAIFFLVEVILRVFAYGWKKFWKERQFDFWITVVSLLPILFLFFKHLEEEAMESNNPKFLPFKFLAVFYALQIPGVMRIVRMLMLIPWFVMFYNTSIKMFRSSFKLLCLLFCFMYFFGVMGVQLFGGNRKEENLIDFTMNDLTGAFMIIIELIETQNIEILMNVYSKVIGLEAARAFFIVAFSIIVMICLNLVLSYVIDIFNDEFDREAKTRQQERHTKNLSFQIRGAKVYFYGENVKNRLSKRDSIKYQGLYCATLYNWQQQRDHGGIEQEEEMIKLFQQKADTVNNLSSSD